MYILVYNDNNNSSLYFYIAQQINSFFCITYTRGKKEYCNHRNYWKLNNTEQSVILQEIKIAFNNNEENTNLWEVNMLTYVGNWQPSLTPELIPVQ